MLNILVSLIGQKRSNSIRDVKMPRDGGRSISLVGPNLKSRDVTTECGLNPKV